ncbi:MAG TPA: molybdenum cofactor biosynthesis protein MoaE [Candidatus Dormibacteraeota bacterium]|jgi:molybdopterin synthase catalytic subunit|nr:molybdenum cofactor biosynthesis protein MoaE [Candidatus Dormibacteraeota bacterium]
MVTALLFARLREQAGTNSETLPMIEGETILDMYRRLRGLHPMLEPDTSLIRPARHEEFAAWAEPVADGDEIAFLPPVSGGLDDLVDVTREPIDIGQTEAAVSHPGAGAVVSFSGIVRDNNRGESVTHLEYEAYEPMARSELRRIAAEVAAHWPGTRVAVLHRIGRLEIGDASVVISVSSPHRAAAFEGCRHVIERIKETVPIWKREYAGSGEVWIEGPTAHPAGDPTR